MHCDGCHSFGHILSSRGALVHFVVSPVHWTLPGSFSSCNNQKLGFVSPDWEFGMASYHTKSFVENMQMLLSAVWFLHLPTLHYLVVAEFTAWLQIFGSLFFVVVALDLDFNLSFCSSSRLKRRLNIPHCSSQSQKKNKKIELLSFFASLWATTLDCQLRLGLVFWQPHQQCETWAWWQPVGRFLHFLSFNCVSRHSLAGQ